MPGAKALPFTLQVCISRRKDERKKGEKEKKSESEQIGH